MSQNKIPIFVPVPSECMGQVIGKRGSNIIQIQQQTQTTIKSCNGSNLSETESGFRITGSADACQQAKRCIMECAVSNITVCHFKIIYCQLDKVCQYSLSEYLEDDYFA